MCPLLALISTVIEIFIWFVIIGVILNWLVFFNVVNPRQRFVYLVGDFLHRVTEPVMRPVRNVLPNLGGVDLSPLLVLLGLWFLQSVLFRVWPVGCIAGVL